MRPFLRPETDYALHYINYAPSMYLPVVCLILGFLHQVAARNTIQAVPIPNSITGMSKYLNKGKFTNKLDKLSSVRRFHGGDSITLQVIIPGRKGHGHATTTVHCNIDKLPNQKIYSISVVRSTLLGEEREMLVNVSLYGKEYGSKNTELIDRSYVDKGKQEAVSYFFRLKSRRPKDNYCHLYTCEISYMPTRFTVVTRRSQVAVLSIDGSRC
ncbi:hypothetical protein PoB_003669400 [Plakobranchus ocellatus]|uniref:ZP domain-containing protein n=1 Tax=Plakobranchus ocellatus TaxID=259542 RepID=A0AAV4AQW2_9GAST|nr:hypothetical protein PoB_003669400 [Plakobranchus ocellatus]